MGAKAGAVRFEFDWPPIAGVDQYPLVELN